MTDLVQRLHTWADSHARRGEHAESALYREAATEIDRLRATHPAGAWRPIETAPKDGTNVLLLNDRGNMATALWQSTGSHEGWWLRGGNKPDYFFNGHRSPTHWMPLPQPPAAQQERAGEEAGRAVAAQGDHLRYEGWVWRACVSVGVSLEQRRGIVDKFKELQAQGRDSQIHPPESPSAEGD